MKFRRSGGRGPGLPKFKFPHGQSEQARVLVRWGLPGLAAVSHTRQNPGTSTRLVSLPESRAGESGFRTARPAVQK